MRYRSLDQDSIQRIKAIVGSSGVCIENEPMRTHTTFRVGGPARLYAAPAPGDNGYETLTELFSFLTGAAEGAPEEGLPFYVIGRGSNLLVSDAGYDGVIVDLSRSLNQVDFSGTLVTAQAGVSLASLASAALKRGLSGLEFASGIPGTLGGAVAMNAGAYGGEMKDVVQTAKILGRNEAGGVELMTLPAAALELEYRNSRILKRHEILLEVTLRLETAKETAIREKMQELQRRRLEKQPLEYPSAGSTFKRPEGYFAGKLIMDTGLAGCRIGGAMVSPKHCGFVINYDNAAASDIYRLCRKVQAEVWERFGVHLELEVKLLGDFSDLQYSADGG